MNLVRTHISTLVCGLDDLDNGAISTTKQCQICRLRRQNVQNVPEIQSSPSWAWSFQFSLVQIFFNMMYVH